MENSSLQELVECGVKLTPMMQQYYDIKVKHQDIILLFRMGDFYEVFFEDAVTASKVLNIAQTHRGKIGETSIPMAGIPHHAAKVYVDRLTKAGHKVAICEQVEDPSEAKGIVKRAVTQIVSPGMPYDLDQADAKTGHEICALWKEDTREGDQYFLTTIDFTTGDFWGATYTKKESLINNLLKLNPKEVISFFGQWKKDTDLLSFIKSKNILETRIHEDYFSPKNSRPYLEKVIPNYGKDKVLKKNPDILKPLGALSFYICSHQDFEKFVHIRPFRLENQTGILQASFSTLAGLEVLPKGNESRKFSILGYLDHSKTPMGSRYLKKQLTHPTMDEKEITYRQNLIQTFIEHHDSLQRVREALENIKDLDRIFAKMTTRSIQSQDLLNLKNSSETYQKIAPILKQSMVELKIKLSKKQVNEFLETSEKISNAINDEVGASLEKGNLIKKGYDRKRDRLAKLSANVDEELLELEERYRADTGIIKLRVKRNNVAGFFIEIPKSQSPNVPKNFHRKQTLTNSERYITEELQKIEKEVILAKEKLSRLERSLFNDLIEFTADRIDSLQTFSNYLTECDFISNLAYVSKRDQFSRPILKKDKCFKIQGAWHPLVKHFSDEEFVTHDLNLNDERYFGLITGPNMAGKTTVMREMAIIQLLTQIGSFVPAKKAEVNICDYLFSRLGASDDITRGQSTFMVEMVETAEILNHATDKSFILLDEVGRGTSTYDGLSIAWSLTESLCKDIKAFTLFATHYHELIDVVNDLNGAINLTVETEVRRGNVQFLYRLIEQAASESYGIYVAKLAGIPKPVLQRANSLLTKLESSKQANKENVTSVQLSFLEEPINYELMEQERLKAEKLSQVEDYMNSLDINRTTPLEALNHMQDIQELLH